MDLEAHAPESDSDVEEIVRTRNEALEEIKDVFAEMRCIFEKEQQRYIFPTVS